MTLLVELTGTHYQYFIVRMTTSAILPMDLIISLEEETKKKKEKVDARIKRHYYKYKGVASV